MNITAELLSEWMNEAADEATEELRAEITQLRAELEQERELADRMYGALEYIDDYCLAYPDLESISAVSSSAIEYIDTWRNK